MSDNPQVQGEGADANPALRTFWIFLMFVAIALALALGKTWKERLHWVGAVLLITGILLAAQGISQVRREWTKRPGFWGTTRQSADLVRGRAATFLWLRWNRAVERWPGPADRLGLGVHTTPVVDEDATVAVAGVATAVSQATSALTVLGGTVERRLELLEERMAEVERQVGIVDTRRIQEGQATRAAMDQEQAEQMGGDQRLREGIADLAGGGLRLQAWGVACLLAGTVMTTIW